MREELLYDEQPVRRRGPVRTVLHVLGRCCLVMLILLLVLLIAGMIGGTIYVRSVLKDAPELSSYGILSSGTATYICDSEGSHTRKLTLPESNRDLVALEDVPLSLQQAVIAIEDERFYSHPGIDPIAIARAFLHGVMAGGHFSEGASTITQQLLKNTVFTDWMSENTFQERLRRKIQEQFLALELEQVMSKQQILEDYLNTINLGAGCYGVQAASWCYFGRDVSTLTLSEAAVIAGISQNPTDFNPLTRPERNAVRRTQVLGAMLRCGFITQRQYDEALADDVYSRIRAHSEEAALTSSVYTYYEDALISQVIDDLQAQKGYTYKQAVKAVYSGGLRIYSAQDASLQTILDEEFASADNFPEGTLIGVDYALSLEMADASVIHYASSDLRVFVRQHFDENFALLTDSEETARAYADAFRESLLADGDGVSVRAERLTLTPQPQASCVLIDQATGYVRALVGGRGEKEASLTMNRATLSLRQPGSTFKTLTVAAPALDARGKTLATVYDNEPYTYTDGTSVSNWDLVAEAGPVTLREMLVRSVNIPAVRCITEITPALGLEYARRMGISTLTEAAEQNGAVYTDLVQALALGGITNGVSCLELCGAYACIANGGVYLAPSFYTQVLDESGEVLLDRTARTGTRALKESTASLLTSALTDVISDPLGTAYGEIDLGAMPAAGKTGTTSDYRDIWFAGYTPYYTCCVWGGYDNNRSLPADGIGHSYSKVLWNAVMTRVHASLPVIAFASCSEVVSCTICTESRQAASALCPSAYTELFAVGTQPAYTCSVHGDGSLTAQASAALGGDAAVSGTSGSSAVSGSAAQGTATVAGSTDDASGNAAAEEDAIVILNTDQINAANGTAAADDSAAADSSLSPDPNAITVYRSDEAVWPAAGG